MTDKTMLDIINRIKDRRLTLQYSFQDLANLTGMSKSTLQRYESGGIKNIPLDKLKTLASALKVSPEWIMGWDSDTNQTNNCDPELTKLLNIFNSLDGASKKELLAYAEFKEQAYKYDPDLKDAENVAYEYIKECEEEENTDSEENAPDQPEKIG